MKNKIIAAWLWLRSKVGNMWGWLTTQGLAFLVTLQALILQIDPSLIAYVKWAPLVIAAIGSVIMILRYFAPPPTAVPMPEGTQATKIDANTIIISTPEPLPAAVVKAEKTMPDVPLAA